jgi:pSer/pThr/pTyr-binding forkhead associated (FHA) protein
MAWLRILTEGILNGEHRIPLDRDPFVLGRNPDCDLRLPHNSVSRHHARITRQDGGFTIEDLGSRCGLYVNDRPINGPTRLRHGDRFWVAGIELIFEELGPDLA